MGQDVAPTRQLSPEKARAILEGAMQEFLARGYAATSMDRVAATAGVSKATVYSHFKDKEGLFIGMIQHLREQKFNAIFGPLESHPLEGTPQEVLKRIALGMLDSIASDPMAIAFMRLVMAESERFPQLAKAFVTQTPTTALKLIGQYLSEHPDLNLPDPEVSARIFIGTLIHYVIFQEMLFGKDVMPMERERLVDGLVGMLTNQQPVEGW
ncbi:MAG: TetR/AcrR family transcriptional regulator [Cyanobacteria bacterium J06597_1]